MLAVQSRALNVELFREMLQLQRSERLDDCSRLGFVVLERVQQQVARDVVLSDRSIVAHQRVGRGKELRGLPIALAINQIGTSSGFWNMCFDKIGSMSLVRIHRTPLLVKAATQRDGNMGLAEQAFARHLEAIHDARLMMVSDLIPPADVILDLGGANAPLHRMGYPHPFKAMTLVDLPPEDRHEMYAQIDVREEVSNGGQVSVLYSDMTQLPMIASASVDLVWSGQSLEHVPEEAGRRMCEEAFRVLKSGGWLCLDTPNGLITRRHAATANLTHIHPEHFIEYKPDDLRAMLVVAGFEIVREQGIRHMPRTRKNGGFYYEDFLTGAAFSDDIDGSYLQFFACRKP